MNIINNEVSSPLPVISEKITCFSGLRPAVIDIETTGLSPDRCFVYLIGVLTDIEGGTRVTQFLASSRDEECEMLCAFFDFIEDFDIYLNYNGNSFDIPFINRRCERLGIDRQLDIRRSVDFLKLFRASYIKDILPNLKLKTVEKLAGIDREDRFSGKDCIEFYRRYAEKGDRTAGKYVLLHNFEDLSCFPALNSLLEKIDICGVLMKIGFPVNAGAGTYFVTDVRPGRLIQVKGEAEGFVMDSEIYGENFTLTTNSLKGIFCLKFELPCEEENLSNARIFKETVAFLRGD